MKPKIKKYYFCVFIKNQSYISVYLKFLTLKTIDFNKLKIKKIYES
jgi:hypothetical protein